jgi:hypothetical protein
LNPSHLVKEFVEQYVRTGNTLDLDAIASEYADLFMFAGPNGTRIIEKQKLLAALPGRQEFFKALGHQSTKVLSLDETLLDAHYAMVRVQFLMRFEKASAQPVDAKLDSTFILYLQDDAPKIVFHIEHEDLQQAMQDRGLLPAKQSPDS